MTAQLSRSRNLATVIATGLLYAGCMGAPEHSDAHPAPTTQDELPVTPANPLEPVAVVAHDGGEVMFYEVGERVAMAERVHHGGTSALTLAAADDASPLEMYLALAADEPPEVLWAHHLLTRQGEPRSLPQLGAALEGQPVAKYWNQTLTNNSSCNETTVRFFAGAMYRHHDGCGSVRSFVDISPGTLWGRSYAAAICNTAPGQNVGFIDHLWGEDHVNVAVEDRDLFLFWVDTGTALPWLWYGFRASVVGAGVAADKVCPLQ